MFDNFAHLFSSTVAEVEVGAILAWLPVIAAARLTEGVADENDELLRLAKANGYH